MGVAAKRAEIVFVAPGKDHHRRSLGETAVVRDFVDSRVAQEEIREHVVVVDDIGHAAIAHRRRILHEEGTIVFLEEDYLDAVFLNRVAYPYAAHFRELPGAEDDPHDRHIKMIHVLIRPVSREKDYPVPVHHHPAHEIFHHALNAALGKIAERKGDGLDVLRGDIFRKALGSGFHLRYFIDGRWKSPVEVFRHHIEKLRVAVGAGEIHDK